MVLRYPYRCILGTNIIHQWWGNLENSLLRGVSANRMAPAKRRGGLINYHASPPSRALHLEVPCVLKCMRFVHSRPSPAFPSLALLSSLHRALLPAFCIVDVGYGGARTQTHALPRHLVETAALAHAPRGGQMLVDFLCAYFSNFGGELAEQPVMSAGWAWDCAEETQVVLCVHVLREIAMMVRVSFLFFLSYGA